MNIVKQLLASVLSFLLLNFSICEEENNYVSFDGNLIKSFTAICANNEEDYCTYSVVYSSTSPTAGYSGNSRISVNEFLYFEYFTVANSANPKIFQYQSKTK